MLFIYSSIVRRRISAEAFWFPYTKKTWREECHEKFPSAEHAKLREWLLQLEDVHGDEMRKRFPLVNDEGE